MKELMKPVKDSENRTETGQRISLSGPVKSSRKSKTHQDYWLSKLKKRSYAWAGKTVQVPEWQVRMFHAGRESWFNLGTPNKAAAAVKARDIYLHLVAQGWDATLTKFKSGSDGSPTVQLTVGDYLQAAEATGYVNPRTFLHYKNCFRTIISEVFGVKADKSRFDYRQGGNEKWVERIDSIRLERVTPGRIASWQQERIKGAGHSPAAIASAKRTVNSYIRCARSLFGQGIRKRLTGIRMPGTLSFDGVELFESGSMKYVSRVDVHALVAAARNELKPEDPEAYKVFLLALFAGMRRAEIDLAEWRMVDWQNNVIRLEETEWLRLKTTDSAGEITVDAEVISELREFMPASKFGFIISSDITRQTPKNTYTWTRPARNDSVRVYYRCEQVFDRLNKWLRGKGVKAHKPLHEMRKEIGALVATQHGIYAASRFLRHSDITTTARHYADHKARISVGLGKLLDTAIKPAAGTAPASA